MSSPDLTRQLERQRQLLAASYALHTSLDLDELLGLILDVAAGGVGAERGTVFLLSEDGAELWSRVLMGDETLEIRLPVGQGIAGAVAQDGRAIRIEDAYADERFDRSWDEQTGYETRQILCAPIKNRGGETVGVFQLLNKSGGAAFDEEDEDYLAALSVHAALAIENARLHASALERERFDREVQLAQVVQRQLQPERREAQFGSVSVAGLNELCEDASGDYYDLLEDLPGEQVGIVIGDVSGHGLQAALLMAATRAYLRAFAKTIRDLPEAMDLLNDHLAADMASGKFVTLFVAVVDGAGGGVDWCNAGHNPPWLYRSATGELEALKPTGRALGIFEDAGYGAGAPFSLDPGDVLLLFTDGVTEARRDGELFGEGRLGELLRGVAEKRKPAEILERARAAVHEWTRGAPNDDDLTMVAVKRSS